MTYGRCRNTGSDDFEYDQKPCLNRIHTVQTGRSFHIQKCYYVLHPAYCVACDTGYDDSPLPPSPPMEDGGPACRESLWNELIIKYIKETSIRGTYPQKTRYGT